MRVFSFLSKSTDELIAAWNEVHPDDPVTD